jgi:hypothetical protein
MARHGIAGPPTHVCPDQPSNTNFFAMPDVTGIVGITVCTIFFTLMCLIGVFVGAPKDDRRG